MARSRRLAVYWGILGLADSRKRSLHEPVSTRQGKYFFFGFFFSDFFFSRKILGGSFSYGKNDQCSICQEEVIEQAPMIVIHFVSGIPFAQKSRHWEKNFVAGIPIAENLVADAWRLDFI